MFVLKIINPLAGLLIAFLCAVVKRGGRNHLVVEFTNNAAELLALFISTMICESGVPSSVTTILWIYCVKLLIAASIDTPLDAYVINSAPDNPRINDIKSLSLTEFFMY